MRIQLLLIVESAFGQTPARPSFSRWMEEEEEIMGRDLTRFKPGHPKTC